jgi:hypothetical protein
MPEPAPFSYNHLGSLATIGRKSAVADFGWIRLGGAFAWWVWGFFRFSLDSLAPSINYSSCRDVAQLYSVRLHSGDMAHIRHSPGHLPGLRIFQLCHAKASKGERRHADVWPLYGCSRGPNFPCYAWRALSRRHWACRQLPLAVTVDDDQDQL